MKKYRFFKDKCNDVMMTDATMHKFAWIRIDGRPCHQPLQWYIYARFNDDFETLSIVELTAKEAFIELL